MPTDFKFVCWSVVYMFIYCFIHNTIPACKAILMARTSQSIACLIHRLVESSVHLTCMSLGCGMKTRIPRVNPRCHRDNMQTPHRKASCPSANHRANVPHRFVLYMLTFIEEFLWKYVLYRLQYCIREQADFSLFHGGDADWKGKGLRVTLLT